MRRSILDEGKRLDGRKQQKFVLFGEVDYLPGSHGSAVFTRGETQSLTTITLGTKLDERSLMKYLTKVKIASYFIQLSSILYR